MSRRLISAISANEFALMMREVVPPMGWSNVLTVANSGGPDSTCLLFLLHRYLKDKNQHGTSITPTRLVSLSIDHDLQVSSSTMARKAANVAEALGIEHVTSKLPWGQGHYPPRPRPGDKIEEKARDMRQYVLFEHMKRLSANALALGHHADDQVETMLMRLGRGSSGMGLGGMRPCRRWGMGSNLKGLNPYAIDGMRKWIVRPLLGVGKDRVYATCEEQQLEYVIDSTNFQPQLTIRNAIRHIIQNGGLSKLVAETSLLSSLPRNIVDNLTDIKNAASQATELGFGLDSGLQELRLINSKMAAIRYYIEKRVDTFLADYQVPSAPGTFMISPLSLRAIDCEKTQEALLFRIIRYVSPEPWGHPQAELGRRTASINTLVSRLCDLAPVATKSNYSFCVGSGVWWRLAAVFEDRLSFDIRNVQHRNLVWIAVRQPPERSKSGNLSLDITKQILGQSESLLKYPYSPILQILYDNRFLISFNVDKILGHQCFLRSLSEGNIKIYIQPSKPWTIPQVIVQQQDESTIIHNHVEVHPVAHQHHLGRRRKPTEGIQSNWITIQYHRSLSSI